MDLDVEVTALQQNCLAEPQIIFVTQRQVGGICGLLKQGLLDDSRDNQIKVLDLLVGDAVTTITGVKVKSRKNLTSPIASLLINQLLIPDTNPWRLTDYGRELLSEAEKRVKEQTIA